MTTLTTTSPDGGPQAFALELLTRLLPGMASVVALLPAALAWQFHGMGRALLPLLLVQAGLLVLGAVALALAAHERLLMWERRVAPKGARVVVRLGLRREALLMTGIATTGPLALALMLAGRGDGLAPLGAALALPTAAVCAGLLLGLCWQGRAPRLVLLPALAVLLTLVAGAGPLVEGGAWSLVAVAAAAALLWRWLGSVGALALRAAAWPRPRPVAWLRRTEAYLDWQRSSGLDPAAPARKPSERYRFIGAVLPLLWLPQLVGQADRLRWFEWGRAYDDAYAGAIYAGCMLMAALLAASCRVTPPLHWRRRLAPRGMTPQRWARRLVLCSLGVVLLQVTLALALAALLQPDSRAHIDAGTWLSLAGDALLAGSFVYWLMGRPASPWVFAHAVGGFVLLAGMLYGLSWLGVTPQRGALWLLLQCAVVLPMTRAAIRAWARTDLNQSS